MISVDSNLYKEIAYKHPEISRMLNVVNEEEKIWRERYGVARRGSINSTESISVLKDVRAVELNILRELLRVCKANNLKPYLIYGSLLGAVRDDGIIAGDDDIDIAFSREDYDKLLLLSEEFGEGYMLQTPSNDDAFYGGYSKLRDIRTTAISPDNWWTTACEGISIDLFPMDYGYADPKRERKKLFKIKQIQRLLYAKCYGYTASYKDMPLLVWKSYKYIGKLISKERLVNLLDITIKAGEKSDRSKFGIYTHYCEKKIRPRYFKANAFDDSMTMRYEGLSIEAPAGWDDVLADLYGEGYLDDIKKEKYMKYHGFYNPYVSYDNYKRRFSGLLRPAPSGKRRVVLFGDEELFNLFDAEYPGYEGCMRIRTENINEFHGTDEDTYAVICAFDVLSVEKQIREIGLRDYYFHWGNIGWCVYSPEGVRYQYNKSKQM